MKKVLLDKDTLYDLYVIEKLQVKKICEYFGVSDTTLATNLKLYDIPLRKGKSNSCPCIDKLKELCNDKTLCNKDIADYFNITLSKLHIWFRENNIERISIRNNEGKKPIKEELEESYKNSNQSELSRIYGVSVPTIKNWLVSYGIESKSFKIIRNSQPYVEKYQKTCLEKYGYDTPLKSPEFQQKLADTYKSETGYRSKIEKEIIEQLSEFLNVELKPNRTILDGKELDGYCSELNFAVEVCGLYWHSEKAGKTSNYHYDKWKRCTEKGIRLYTIFENEWKEKSELIKRFIYMNQGLAKNRLYARDCLFDSVPKKIAEQFCIDNHLQGKSLIKKAFGLYYNDELILLMTFGTHHRDNKTLVMNRYCGKFDYLVVGGASKLMKNAKLYFDKPILTWSDNRWSNGNLYEKIGCKKLDDMKSDYYWTDFYKLYSKQSRAKKVTGQPKELTEKEYNESLGMSRIWDCGKIKWLYE